VHGGLGEAVASVLMQQKSPSSGGVLGGFFKIIGIPDEYTVTGSQQDIFDHYGINEKGIADVVLSLIK
jgi:transketolase